MPPAVQKLSSHQQSIWVATFNSAFKAGKPEDSCFAIAWGAVNKQRTESMHPDFLRIKNLFSKRYGEEMGTAKFEEFITNNELNVSKLYNPTTQFRESFEWVEPLIVPYKRDAEAKYYLVRAITANISMNNKEYTKEKLMEAANTLSWRPVNLNHDHTAWFPYPRTRVDFSKYSDMSVEATLRVDNKDYLLQEMLDSGKIKHPSIEGRPDPNGGYHFMGMALLTVGEQVPGDPLTEILPLAFNESVGAKVCELQSGKVVCNCPSNVEEVKNTMSENQMKNLDFEIENLRLKEQLRDAEKKLVETIKEKDFDSAAFKKEKESLNQKIVDNAKAFDEEKQKMTLGFLEKQEPLIKKTYNQEGVIGQLTIENKSLKENISSKEQDRLHIESMYINLTKEKEAAERKTTEALVLAESYRVQKEQVIAINNEVSKTNLEYVNELTATKQELLNEKRSKVNVDQEIAGLKESVKGAEKRLKQALNVLETKGVYQIPSP